MEGKKIEGTEGRRESVAILDSLDRVRNGIWALYCVGLAEKDANCGLEDFQCLETLSYVLDKVVEDLDTVIIMLNSSKK